MVPNLSNADFLALCRKHGACDSGIEYLEQSGHDLATFWRTTHMPHWMLWLIAKQIGVDGWPTQQELVLATCAVIEPILKCVPAGEERPRIAIETARRWCRGEATITEVLAAADAALDAAYHPAYAIDAADAAHAATNADYAAAYAAYAAYHAAYAATYAVDAARAAAYAADAIDAAARAAYTAAHAAHAARADMANIIRGLIPLVEDETMNRLSPAELARGKGRCPYRIYDAARLASWRAGRGHKGHAMCVALILGRRCTVRLCPEGELDGGGA